MPYRVIYWLVGALPVFLGIAYAGLVPIIFLGPPAERPYWLNIIVSTYAPILYLCAANATWAGWRMVKGISGPEALRPFPRVVWLGAAVLGLLVGLVAYRTP